MAEAHTLCTQLENAMQDTMKEQDQSLRVMNGLCESQLSHPFYSRLEKENGKAIQHFLDLSIHLGFSSTADP